jgi:O-antigen ligase
MITHNPENIKNHLPVFVLGMPVLASLICGNIFIYKTLLSFWLFGLATIFLFILATFKILKHPPLVRHLSNWPILLFSLLYLWVLMWPLIHNAPNGNLKNLVILFGLLHTVSMVILLRMYQSKIYFLFLLLYLFGIIESIICIGQFYGLLSSGSQWFKVSGTFPNPNITAIFLTLILPTFEVLRKAFKQNRYKIFLLTGFLIIGFAIIILKCRTAWLGSAIALIFFFLTAKPVKLIIKKKRLVFILFIITTGIIVLPLLQKVYELKKDSADGRVMIWKISSQMITIKPFSGYGYGLFEKYYNQEQARYLKSTHAASEEKNIARHVKMAYNEYLEMAVEGGIIGLGLFIAILVSLFITFLKLPPNLNSSAAAIGLLQVVVMSTVNFTIQAVPVLAMFTLYAAIIISAKPISSIPARYTRQTAYGIGLVFIAISIGLIHKHFSLYTSLKLQNKALLISSHTPFYESSKLIAKVEKDLSNCESFYNAALAIAIRKGDLDEAYNIFQKGRNYTSTHNFYLNGGYVCESLEKFKEAEEAYLFVNSLVPTLMSPKFRLMNLYLRLEQKLNAKEMAQAILDTNPKVENAKSKAYRKAAKQILTPL